MASRGSKAKNGHITINEYRTVETTETGVKVLEGNDNNHSLSDYAHTPKSIYAKVRSDGSLKEMRFYNSFGWPIIEIAFHPERNLDKSGKRIVHCHMYSGLKRGDPTFLTENIKDKYSKYLKEFGLYDKC